MENEPVIRMPIDGSEIFAGPKSMMDALMAIEWSFVSAENESDDITDFTRAERLSDHAVRIYSTTHNRI